MNVMLMFGDIGDDVKILQEKLKILGFYHGFITGSFEAATLEGVKALQQAYGLNVTGVVDENTWNLLYELTSPAIAPISIYPTLSYGEQNQYVTDLQTKLKTLLYYSGSINSVFDLETENAVKRLQMNNDITANGIVDSTTWNVINTLYGNLNSCVTDTNNNSNNYISYTVKSGDTLYAIARQYNTTVDAIKSLNNLTSNTLYPGQILKIPSANNSNNYISYTVKSGDKIFMGNNG